MEDDIKQSKFCDLPDRLAAEAIHKKMEDISLSILKLIQNFHPRGALDKQYHDVYKPGNKGCCNQLLYSEIAKNYSNLTKCRHRAAAKLDPIQHHNFKTIQLGKPKRVMYRDKVVPALDNNLEK